MSKHTSSDSQLRQVAFGLSLYAEGLSQFAHELRCIADRVRRPPLRSVRGPTSHSQKEETHHE